MVFTNVSDWLSLYMHDSLTGAANSATPSRPAPTPAATASQTTEGGQASAAVPAGLGKRQGNLLTAILRGIPLMGRMDQVPFAEADVRKCLARFQPADDGAATGLVNRMRPRLLDAVVGPAARMHGYVRGLPEGGVEPLLDAVGRAVGAPLVLRVTFGASVRMPLRALSYVLPVVRMAVRIHDVAGQWPYVQATYLGRLGARINDLPARAVAEEGRLLADCLDAVLNGTELADRYGLFADLELPSGDAELRSVLARLDTRGCQDILDRLRGKGGSLSDRQTLEYAAAHVLVHDREAVPLTLLRGVPAPAAPVVIDVGGLQERHFYGVRSVFAARAGREHLGPLVLTRHSVPPYTMSREGDIALRDFLDTAPPLRTTDEVQRAVLGGTGLPNAVRRDLELLCAGVPLETLTRLR